MGLTGLWSPAWNLDSCNRSKSTIQNSKRRPRPGTLWRNSCCHSWRGKRWFHEEQPARRRGTPVATQPRASSNSERRGGGGGDLRLYGFPRPERELKPAGASAASGATDCTASSQLGFPHGNSPVCWIFCRFVEPRPFESPLARSSGEAMLEPSKTVLWRVGACVELWGPGGLGQPSLCTWISDQRSPFLAVLCAQVGF